MRLRGLIGGIVVLLMGACVAPEQAFVSDVELFDPDHTAIVELKQDGLCYSPMKQILLDLRVQKFKISKYCLGTALSNPTVKANRFKRKIRMIKKIINTQQNL